MIEQESKSIKRKAEFKLDIENNVLLKSLRRSISDLTAEKKQNTTTASTSISTEFLEDFSKTIENYQIRLNTFRGVNRFYQPNEISPVSCARRGWSYLSNDLIQCEDCKKIISISILPNDSTHSSKLFNICVRNVQRKFVEGHDTACKWRTAEPVNLRISYSITNNYAALKKCVKEVAFLEEIIDESFLSSFKELDNKFFLLASICGWTATKENDDNKIECRLCGRKLVLMVFFDGNPLNFLEQHHSYCPIIDQQAPLWREVTTLQMIVEKPMESLLNSVCKVKKLLNSIIKK